MFHKIKMPEGKFQYGLALLLLSFIFSTITTLPVLNDFSGHWFNYGAWGAFLVGWVMIIAGLLEEKW